MWSSYSYAFGPTVALAAMLIIALLLRWAFKRDPNRLIRAVHRGHEDQYGALVSVNEPRDEAEGQRARNLLRGYGIRATVADTLDGRRVLVFPTDAARSRAILSKEL